MEGPIRLVGHRVREVRSGLVQVETQISCERRTFSGAATGSAAPTERLEIPALAALRALDSCVQIFYHGLSSPALVLDGVVEVSVGDFPVAVVRITASEKANPTPLVAACPLAGMSDLAMILATMQATTRTVSRWLAWGDSTPRSEKQGSIPMTKAGDRVADGGLARRVEALLESLTAVASARVLIDEKKGTQVHIIATPEMPVSEVSRAAMSTLTWGFGFDVAPEQIMVVQSRLSRDELNSLLERKKTESHTAIDSPEGHVASPPGPPPSVHDTGLLEISVGGSDGTASDRSEPDLPRLKLEDFHLNRRSEGGYGAGVRLGGNGTSVTALRQGAETEADMLELPANAVLDAIQEFLRKQRSGGPGVVLKLLGARRLRNPQHDIVVILIAAVVNGRNIPLTGAAASNQGVAQAAILATLQATNAFVAGTLLP